MQLVDGDLRGRDKDFDSVMSLLGHGSRLVTLIGMGGVGKTVLARHVLRELVGPAGMDQFWFDFESEVPEQETIMEIRGKIRQIIIAGQDTGVRSLVVIDTVPSGVRMPDLVRSLLEEHPRLQILATSRGRLRISLERPIEIQPLSLPGEPIPADSERLGDFIRSSPALDFFIERVRAVTPNLKLERNAVASMLAICRRLGGLPLALQMAALKSNILAPDAILTELDRSVAVLEDREPSSPARHRTMLACVASSIDQLTGSERAVLAAVAEFEGGCSLATLRSLDLGSHPTGEPVQLLSTVSILVEGQLLRSVATRPEGARLVVMPLIRDYLALELDTRLKPDSRQYLIEALLRQSRVMAGIRGPECDRARSWFDEEYANLSQVLGWLVEAKDMSAAADLVHSLYSYWIHRGLIEEGFATVARVMSADGLDDRAEAQILGTLGGLRAHISSYTSAYGELARARDLWRLTGSAPDLADSLVAFSAAALEVDGFPAAHAALREAMDLYRLAGDGWAHARALALLGAAAAGDSERSDFARACLEEASADLLAHGDQVAASLPMEQLGRLLLDEGDYEQARLVLDHGLDESRGVGDQVQTSALLNLLAWADTLTGRPEDAATRYLESLQIAVRLGLKARAVWCLEGLAESLVDLGERPLATTAAASAAIIRADLGLEVWVEFCCPRRPNGAHMMATPRSTWLASVGGNVWPPERVLTQAPEIFAGLSAARAQARLGPPVAGTPDGLTRREVEILGLVASGFTNRDIAEKLVISIDTVGRHISNLYRKIGARGRADATAYAWRMSLVPQI